MLATIPLVGGFFQSAAQDVFGALASAFEAASSWAINGMVHAMTATTTPDLGAGWFSGPSSPLHTMRLVVVALAVPIILLGICQSVIRSDMSELLRRALLYPILAGAGTLAVVAVTTMLVTATDQMSTAMLASTGHDFGKFAAQAFALSTVTMRITPAANPVFVMIGLSLLTLVASFFIWLELAVRMGAIYIAVLFMPLGLVALCWQAGAAAAKRLAEFLVAVIFSKFVIAATISVGAAALAAPVAGAGPGKATAHLVAGMALLLLAGFAPVALMRWIPHAEGAAATHGLGRKAGGAAVQAASTLDRARSLASSHSPGDSGGQSRQSGGENTGGGEKTAAGQTTSGGGGAAAKAGGGGAAAKAGGAGPAGVAGAAAKAGGAAARAAGQAGGVTDASSQTTAQQPGTGSPGQSPPGGTQGGQGRAGGPGGSTTAGRSGRG